MSEKLELVRSTYRGLIASHPYYSPIKKRQLLKDYKNGKSVVLSYSKAGMEQAIGFTPNPTESK